MPSVWVTVPRTRPLGIVTVPVNVGDANGARVVSEAWTWSCRDGIADVPGAATPLMIGFADDSNPPANPVPATVASEAMVPAVNAPVTSSASAVVAPVNAVSSTSSS